MAEHRRNAHLKFRPILYRRNASKKGKALVQTFSGSYHKFLIAGYSTE
jgi:hypothetical protein